MPRHTETRTLPFSPEQLYELVSDIERYPEFLPWCLGARVLEHKENVITADLIIGYKMFREKFTSIVTLDAPKNISVSYVAGPLSHLKNEWHFEPAKNGACALSFEVDFDFHSPLMRSMMEIFFDKALRRMVTAFEQRAVTLYPR